MNFRRGVVFTFAIHLMVILLDKGAGFVLLALGADKPGVVGGAQVLSVLPFVLMPIANLGLATALVYMIRRKEADPQIVAQTTSFVALVWGGLVGAVAFTILGLAIPAWRPDWEVNIWLLVPVCVAVPLMLLKSYYNSIQLALNRIRDFNLVHLLDSIGFLPLFLLCWWLADETITTGLVYGRVLISGIMAAMVVWMLRKAVRFRLRPDPDFLRGALRFGWKANITSTLTAVNQRINILLLPVFLVVAGAATGQDELQFVGAQVAYFSYAATFAELIWNFPEAMRDLFFSKIAESSEDRAREITPVLTRISLVLALMGGGLVYVTMEPVMTVLMQLVGRSWESWNDPILENFVLLIPGTIAFTVAKTLQNDLGARGMLGRCITCCVVTTVTLVVGDALLIPEYGTRGAAMALSAAYIISSIYTMILYQLDTGVPFHRCLFVRPSDWRYVTETAAAVMEKVRRKRPA